MATSLLIVTQAFTSDQDGMKLHPDLFLWQKQLHACKRRWFFCSDRTPCEWYGVLQNQSATALLTNRVHNLPSETSQCWMVTPYHAVPDRDSVRIYPEGVFTWYEPDAMWLCDTLNPLLSEEGMSLHHVGAALLLACRDPMDASPVSFSTVAGKHMPNRHHKGDDGGRLNRLMAEIQMMLHMQQPERSSDRAEINGVWISDPAIWPQAVAEKPLTIATRNPSLLAMVDGRDASVTISEAERLSELSPKSGAPLPERVLLAGEGHAVLLENSWLPRFGKDDWSPKLPAPEAEMPSLLQGAL